MELSLHIRAETHVSRQFRSIRAKLKRNYSVALWTATGSRRRRVGETPRLREEATVADRGLCRRGVREPAHAPPRRRLLDADDPANSGGLCLRPERAVPLAAAVRSLSTECDRPALAAAKPTETEDFSFGSTNGSRQDACRPLNRLDPGKHRLFCNPERRGVDFRSGLAAALDDEEQPRARLSQPRNAEVRPPAPGALGPEHPEPRAGESRQAAAHCQWRTLVPDRPRSPNRRPLRTGDPAASAQRGPLFGASPQKSRRRDRAPARRFPLSPMRQSERVLTPTVAYESSRRVRHAASARASSAKPESLG